jgi:hypothetical protein
LISTKKDAVYIGVDHTNVASGSGRQSVRLESKKTYTHGLIILDASHMPGGACGSWPAFWTVGRDWPSTGEIDIIEGVNSQVGNSMALHTGEGCSITNNGGFSGTVGTDNCDVNASGQPTNAGCSIRTPNSGTYGTGFNNAQGGIYATEWTSSAIKVWFFPRSAIPYDITSGSPQPNSGNWGQPLSVFEGGCDIDKFFADHQLVFDTTFCGDWAGQVWSTDATCSKKAPTCEDYVKNNPHAFADMYWEINSLKVYQDDGTSNPPAGPSSASFSSPVATSVPVVATSASNPWGGIPPVVPTSVVSATETAVPTTGFSRGGNGRPTKTWGWGHGGGGTAKANFVVAEATATATGVADVAVISASASASVSAVGDVPVQQDDAVAAAAASAQVTPAPIVDVASFAEDGGAASDGSADDIDNGNTAYVTVTALAYDDFSNPDADMSVRGKRDLDLHSDWVMVMDAAEQLQARRASHVHRHLARHGHGAVAGAGAGSGAGAGAGVFGFGQS